MTIVIVTKKISAGMVTENCENKTMHQ